MVEPQDAPTVRPPTETNGAGQATAGEMIVLSNADWIQLDALIRQPRAPLAELPLPRMVSPSQEATEAAAALTTCRTGQYCTEDIAPPVKMRVDKPIDLGDRDATLTFKPVKIELSVPLKPKPHSR